MALRSAYIAVEAVTIFFFKALHLLEPGAWICDV